MTHATAACVEPCSVHRMGAPQGSCEELVQHMAPCAVGACITAMSSDAVHANHASLRRLGS